MGYGCHDREKTLLKRTYNFGSRGQQTNDALLHGVNGLESVEKKRLNVVFEEYIWRQGREGTENKSRELLPPIIVFGF